jgi:hypothetical protein
MNNHNNQQRARANELETLVAIGQIGWLNASQVASWVWPASSAHSARVSADKVLKRLLSTGLIKQRSSGKGLQVYVLTRTGAAQANECARGRYGLREDVALFRDGYSLSQLDDERQRLAAEYLGKQHNAGNMIFGGGMLRRAIEDGFVDEQLKGADGYVIDRETQEAHTVLVVRNLHQELVSKAARLKEASGALRLIGQPGFVKAMEKELGRA